MSIPSSSYLEATAASVDNALHALQKAKRDQVDQMTSGCWEAFRSPHPIKVPYFPSRRGL